MNWKCKNCGGTLQHKTKMAKGKVMYYLQCTVCKWIKPSIHHDL